MRLVAAISFYASVVNCLPVTLDPRPSPDACLRCDPLRQRGAATPEQPLFTDAALGRRKAPDIPDRGRDELIIALLQCARIDELRSSGLSLRQVARKLGVGETTVRRVWSGSSGARATVDVRRNPSDGSCGGAAEANDLSLA
jgi:hypothetical protein